MRRAAPDLMCVIRFGVLASLIILCPLAAWAQVAPQQALGTGHAQPVVAVAFSPNGSLLASASRDKTVILWDTLTSQVRYTLQGHSRVPIAIAFSADGSALVSCGRNSHQMGLFSWSTVLESTSRYWQFRIR